eukprot:gene3977-2836_t
MKKNSVCPTLEHTIEKMESESCTKSKTFERPRTKIFCTSETLSQHRTVH